MITGRSITPFRSLVLGCLWISACSAFLPHLPSPIATTTTKRWNHNSDCRRSSSLFAKDDNEAVVRTIKTLKNYEPKTSVTSFLLKQIMNSDTSSKSKVEATIETAQLLMDPKRQIELKKDLKKQFPIIPDSVLDSSLELTSKAFQDVAPQTVKEFLKPGGYAKQKPQIVKMVVDKAMPLKAVRDIPILGDSDKREILTAVVDLVMDSVFADAQTLLEAPEVRLEALQLEIRKVQEKMGRKRLWQYRVQRNTKTLAITGVAAAALAVTYFLRNTVVVSACLSVISKIAAVVWSVVTFAYSKVVAVLGLVKASVAAVYGWLKTRVIPSMTSSGAKKAAAKNGKRAFRR